MSDKHIKVGIIGFGTVGCGTAKILLENHSLIEKRLGCVLELKRIVDIDLSKDRGVALPQGVLTDNLDALLDDPEIAIVVELIGGIQPAKQIILKALAKGKHVVTANKALLATEGAEIFQAALDAGLELGFEASVAGGVPVIKVIKESMVANRISAISGILNGTANYILSKMTHEGVEFAVALQEAQRLGFAEVDPRFDIEGIDSAHKLAIVATLVFGIPLSYERIFIEGISSIALADLSYAAELGYKIKLLAIAKIDDEGVELRVHPAMVPMDYLISAVDGVYNAIYIEADAIGSTLYYGRGAGSLPTGSAVVSDIVDIARNILTCSRPRVPLLGVSELTPQHIKEKGDFVSRYYFRFSVIDKPGVLSSIAGILGECHISIQSVIQKGRKIGETVSLVMLSHKAKETDVRKAFALIDCLDVVTGPSVFIRVEGADE